MKKNLLNDERVINEKRKITNEAFLLIMLMLITSILVQQFIFKAHFSEYATEFICFFGASIYILIRNIFVGNRIIADDSKKTKIMLTNSIVSGVSISAVIGFQNIKDSISTTEFLITLIITFLITSTFSFITMYTIAKLNQHKINKIEKELDHENDNE